MRYVMIGCSYAAAGAIEAIRAEDPAGPIVVIADEPYGSYARPRIPHYLEGETNLEKMYYRPPEFFERMRVERRLGETVTRIDPATHQVVLAGGQALAYDKLLVATGGRPTVPPTPGSDSKGVFTLIHLDEAKKLSAWIAEVGVKQAVVIGAGLIGLNTLPALAGMKLTLVELLPRVMGLALDDEASGLVERRLKDNGVDVRTGTTVKQIVSDGDGRVRAVTLSTGDELPCQLVLFAVGVRPNHGLVDGSGIAVQRGIVVNERMETTVPDIYAAGDVVEAYDMVNEDRRVIAILPLAYEQGRVAGANMSGRAARYAGGLALNSMTLFGLPIMTMGITLTDNRPDLSALVHRADRVFRKLVFRGDVLVGAILLGDLAGGGILTGLIKSRQPVAAPKEQLLRGDLVDYAVARQARATALRHAYA